MYKNFKILLIILVSLKLINAETVVIPIEGTIDLGLPLVVERGIKKAETLKADHIVFKINTFGGRVDAATTIKDAILKTNITTIAFINNRAISAGALIALSCDSVIMASGSSIGAVTPVDQKGNKLTEKQVSYMRAEMRSTLERNNRNPLIGEAMVDESIEIDSITEKGKLLTLTSKEALKLGICDSISDDIDEYLKTSSKNISTITENGKEKFIRLLSNPMVSSLLLIAGLLGIFFEIKAPGFGFPGILGLSSLFLYIFSHYVLRLANWLEISLIVVGIILVILEAFVIPGFGIAGILGTTLIFGGVYFTMISDLPFRADYISAGWGLLTVIIISIFGIIMIFKRFLNSNFYKKRALFEEENRFQNMHIKIETESINIGDIAVVINVLKPTGFVEIDGKDYEAISTHGFIEKNKKVKVVKIDGNILKVKQIEEI